MTKTVKKLIEDAKEAIGDDFDYLLDEILEKHEEELAEKDEEIFKLHNECKSLFCQIGTEQIKNDKLKQQQLFKEDFDEYCQYCKWAKRRHLYYKR